MVARGQPRGGDIQTVFSHACLPRTDHARVTRQAEVVAAGKIGEFAFAEADVGAIQLLERLGFNHGEDFRVWSLKSEVLSLNSASLLDNHTVPPQTAPL